MSLYLGLNGKLIRNPVIYCKLHDVYLNQKDVKRKRCNQNGCHHIITKSKWKNIKNNNKIHSVT